jgi:hypothetical protein
MENRMSASSKAIRRGEDLNAYCAALAVQDALQHPGAWHGYRYYYDRVRELRLFLGGDIADDRFYSPGPVPGCEDGAPQTIGRASLLGPVASRLTE